MKTLPNNYYDDIATKWVKDFHANASYNLDAMKEDYAEICSTIISKSVAKNPNVKVKTTAFPINFIILFLPTF